MSIMKKIGYQALPYPNFGSLLQAAALYNIIKKLGYDCNLINYKEFVDNPEPTQEEINMLCLDEDGASNIAVNISDEEKKRLENKIMRYRFEEYARKIFSYDKKLKSFQTGGDADYHRVQEYDAFICGSDQVWNPEGNWFVPANYLQFAPRGKRIGYAASLGRNRIPLRNQINIPLWKHYLEEMTFLSSREEIGSEVIRKLTGKDVTTVLDPTLLLTDEEWMQMPDGMMPKTVKQYIDNKDPYIVGYFLHGYEKYKNYIENYAKEHDLKIVWLVGTDTSIKTSKNRAETTPGGFLRIIKNASAVCTDSFHGCCFSIIFKRKFVSTIINGMDKNLQIYDIRKFDLLERLGIADRMVDEKTFNNIDNDINYLSVEKYIHIEKDRSMEFLAHALKSCTEYKVTEKDKPEDVRLLPLPKTPRTIQRVPLDDPLNCTGCGACRNICPVDAISMVPNEKGFIEPVVDEVKCIKCGKCLRQCPLRSFPQLFREKSPAAYAAWSLEPEFILNSSTGGIFSVIADWVLKRGGIVYGSVINEDNTVTVQRATNYKELSPLRGSKYVQSDTELSFREVKKDLLNGNYVLFSGTSCQVAGLYAYLGRDYNRLVTIDLICGGLVSPLVYNKYIEMREMQAGSSIESVKFRAKDRGWGPLQFIMNFKNGKKYNAIFDFEPYGFMYLKKFTVRTSCHRCIFKGVDHRSADFTIGDFWGIGKKIEFSHPKSQGVSVVLTNSIKARCIFDFIRATPGNIFCEERSIEEMLEGNPILLTRPHKPVMYNKIFKSFKEKGFMDAFTEWFGPDDIREIRK